MNAIQLTPKPGQTPSIGYGPIFFMSPNAPMVAQNDPWQLVFFGETPNLKGIGHAMPWESDFTFDGALNAAGSMTISGVCESAGQHNVADSNGVLLRSDLSGTIGQPAVRPLMGNDVCQYAPAGPPPPPPVLNLQNLVNALLASRQTHVAVANWRIDSTTVMYTSAPDYEPAPIVVTIPFMYCLSDMKAALIASLIGGTVKGMPPTGYYSDLWVVGAVLPNVNWIFMTINGVLMKALGMALVQQFDTSGDLMTALLSAFAPA